MNVTTMKMNVKGVVFVNKNQVRRDLNNLSDISSQGCIGVVHHDTELDTEKQERNSCHSNKPLQWVNNSMNETDETRTTKDVSKIKKPVLNLEKKMSKSEVQRCMDWLFQKQGEMEIAEFGKGKMNVLDALKLQHTKATEILHFRENIDSVLKSENLDEQNAKELNGNYDSVKALSEKRNSCLEIISQIASLEDLVQSLSTEFDSRSVHLVNTTDITKQKGGPTQSNESLARTAQNCISSVRQNWRWVFQVMQCAEVHLRNAAAYQEFFQEVNEAEYWMNTTLSRIHLSFDRSKLIGNKSDAEKMLQEIKDVLAAYLQWQTKIDYLFDKAKQVVPIPLRLRSLNDPKPVIALTDYNAEGLDFIEGETLTLLDNTDKKKWKVRTEKGQVGFVPAVIILLPAPSAEALDAAIKLRLQLLSLWTSSVKRLGYQMIAFMLLVLRDWTEEEVNMLQAMAASDKVELLRILQFIEDTLLENWNGYGDFQELQERITRLKMILEESTELSGQADAQNNNMSSSVVVQVKILENLLNKYKDFWTFWETFKCVAEMLKHPKFMLVCDKWEQLRFVTSAHFVKFWDTQLDLIQNDITKTHASLVMHETPSEELISSEVTIEEEKEETTTDTVTTALEEEQHTFIITGVLDPRDGKTKLSLQDAIMLGIVDQATNQYINPKTGQSMSMTDAMNEGSVLMEFVSKKKIREEKNSYGLITIKITKETRPYSITGVIDPKTEEKLSVTQAAALNILDTHSSTYRTESGDKIPIADAIHSGLVIVEYQEGEELIKPETVTKTYAVHGVVDQKKKTKVSFSDAIRDGLLAKDTGEYVNNVTKERVGVHEAIMKGFIKARIIADPSKLEINPENKIVVEKLSNAKSKLLKSVKALKAFKTLGVQK
ncbi:dystonin-like isoform X2 [Physella acuta]|uniref:dystonin-like isoform X2 n=1 Tax=Physella acuta TaxID=109671 RepID=UPI0027DBADC7|nr:dystonin-like isoform X2 [Physella acuta]